jgi:hypothetical protein
MTPTTDLQKLLAEATKGPWRVEQDTTLIWGACNQDDTTTYGMGYPIAEAKLRTSGWNADPINWDTINANARLIAMAPDLAARVLELEAENKRLREGLVHIDAIEIDWTKGVDENLERVKSIARAALKGGEI